MILELKPEQQQILELATKSGMSPEEVLDQAFAIIREQLDEVAWATEEREAIAAHIEQGVAQAQRGELIDAEDAVRILQERRAHRQIA
jgi:predicted transcriptional regulator